MSDIYGKWMSIAIGQLQVRFLDAVGRSEEAADYAEAFLAAAHGISNQGPLPFPEKVAKGRLLPFQTLPDGELTDVNTEFEDSGAAYVSTRGLRRQGSLFLTCPECRSTNRRRRFRSRCQA